MFRKINNKFIKIGGNISNLNRGTLNFVVRGPSFLNWLYVPNDPTSPTTVARPNGLLFFRSTKPNSVTINYGDGNVINYPFRMMAANNYGFNMRSQITSPSSSGEYAPAYDNHIFADGDTGVDRIVSVTFQDPTSITTILSSLVLLRQEYPADIDKLPSLVSLTINNATYLTRFPPSIANIKSLTGLTLVAPSQTRVTTFTDAFLGLTNLVTLGISGVYNFTDPIASGAYKIGQFGNKLTNLSVAASSLGVSQTDLPVEWLNLTNLTNLNISFNQFTRTPDLVGQLTSLTALSLGGYGTESVFNDWGDFRGLVNLTSLTALVMQSLPPILPSWFNNLVKLKGFNVGGSYNSQLKTDTFVDSMYDLVTNNAAITGANTLPFRGMNVNILQAAAPQNSPRPSGTFQQPTGYVQGTSNGTPASQLEKVWVLTNQYGHTWTMNPT